MFILFFCDLIILMFVRIKKLILSFSIYLIICSCVMNNKWFLFCRRIRLQPNFNLCFLSYNTYRIPDTYNNYYNVIKKEKKKKRKDYSFFSKGCYTNSSKIQKLYGENDETTYRYTKYDKKDETYINILERKADEIKNSKNCFNNKIKTNKNENVHKLQPLDYTTLHLLSIELNSLLSDSIVEHITQADDKTIVLHLSKRDKEYYLYICYDNANPVISLGLKIKKLFNRFIEDDYAQKLNPVIKYSIISNVYMKKSFVKILCIDLILKRKSQEDIDIEDILNNQYSARKVTLLFDLHNNSCISFLINKSTNEILISPHNYVTEKTIDKSYKEGHKYIFPQNNECKLIPDHYEFFSTFSNLFKSRKEQNFISSLMDMYEGVSYNMLLKFCDYLNIPTHIKFEEMDKGTLLDFFNKAYIKWLRFLNLKEKTDELIFYPHYDYKLNIPSVLNFVKSKKKKNYTIVSNIPGVQFNSVKGGDQGNTNEDDNNIDNIDNINNNNNINKGGNCNSLDYTHMYNQQEEYTKCNNNITKNNIDTNQIRNDKKNIKLLDNDNKHIHFETTIELVYYYYCNYFSVNEFYTTLKYCKDFLKKKLPQYEDMLLQYKNDREICEKAYLLHENINKLTVFNHTISKMNDWLDKKTYDALKLIENELRYNSLEDNRKKFVKKQEEDKKKEETLMKKIINTQPNTIRTPQNIYKGSLLIKINETDLSSPFLIIGKNSKQNEKISTQILKFNDLWFHVHEYPGGHVILRNKKIKDKIITADTNLADIIIDDDIKYAANMAAYFSKARKMEKTLVCFTLGKYVLKDNTLNEGAVEVLKYKLIYGRPNKVANIIKDLNERNKEIEICKKKKKKKK
ncbi:putative FbpA domain protein [Plasmodium gaboni]|uniref:Putative FbpA domain protein n=1 Tax=Plasmodium gaboni TaxID=647221 RepID=A0A151LGD0_9APIC|nr:putative FbpA domain protein [Plasmodium gaboni]KYN98021.1 putative FbpA domain protein [Plasmodium gaboni]